MAMGQEFRQVSTTANPRCAAPKIGVVVNSILGFDSPSKDRSEAALRALLKDLTAKGAIAAESIVTPRIFGPVEALRVADQLAAAQVDLVVVANVAFPNGHVFLTLATHPGLAKTPIAVVSDPEPEGPEWTLNAWCGVIMNNHVAKQLGRPVVTIPGPYAGTEFRNEFARLLRVAATIRTLRRELLVRFGDAPGGFHSASGNQLAYARVFGTRVDTVDWSAVLEACRTGKVSGYLGEASFSEKDVQATVKQITDGREVRTTAEVVEKGARLYQAFRIIVRANGYTSAAFRCWPEALSPHINTSTCLVMGLLLSNGDVTAASCESDWPTAVAQTMGTLLTGSPAACLDWVNYTAGSEIVQLGHCGVGIAGHMASGTCCGGACEAVSVHPGVVMVGRQVGPTLVGQFKFGPKTGICLMQDTDGEFKILTFRGESSPQSARGMNYVAADVVVPDYKQLNRLILDEGFPHHLAVALGDVHDDVRMLCRFLGVRCLTPHECA